MNSLLCVVFMRYIVVLLHVADDSMAKLWPLEPGLKGRSFYNCQVHVGLAPSARRNRCTFPYRSDLTIAHPFSAYYFINAYCEKTMSASAH